MIVLAVTTCFFAESLREHISTKEKVKRYVISYIEDLRNETAEMHGTLLLQDTILSKMNIRVCVCLLGELNPRLSRTTCI